MDLLKSTNPVIYWAACYLELTVGSTEHIVLFFSVNSFAHVTLSSIAQVLAVVKHGYLAWFGFLHLDSLLSTNGVLEMLGEGDSTKLPGTGPLHW